MSGSIITSHYKVTKTEKDVSSKRGQTGVSCDKKQTNEDFTKLREFDMEWKYGPCTGLARLERWDRAEKYGLNPPESIRNLILNHKDDLTYTQCLQFDVGMGNTPTPLRQAIRFDDKQEVLRLLQKAGDGAADLINEDHSPDCIMQSCSKVEGNALYYAVDRNRLEVVKILLEYGGDVTTLGHFGETCVHNAARHNWVPMAQVLIGAGGEVYGTDDQGRYPIHYTGLSHYNTSAMIHYLLEEAGKKEDINLKDFHDRTPLHEAAFAQNIDAVKSLLSFGADVHAASKEGNTPLHGVRRGTMVWNCLIENGADVNVKNKNGELPGELVK